MSRNVRIKIKKNNNNSSQRELGPPVLHLHEKTIVSSALVESRNIFLPHKNLVVVRVSGYWRANKSRQLNYEYMISNAKILTVSGLKKYREQDSQNQLFALVFA